MNRNQRRIYGKIPVTKLEDKPGSVAACRICGQTYRSCEHVGIARGIILRGKVMTHMRRKHPDALRAH